MGSHVAKMLAAEGAKVVICDVNVSGAETVVNEIKNAGGEAVACCLDITSIENDEKIIQTAIDTYGKIDILACIAGVIKYNMAEDVSEKEYDFVFGVNAKAIYGLCKAALPHMKAQKYGRIVAFASNAAFGFGGSCTYSGSKGACLSYVEALGNELPESSGVKANVVMPSAVTQLFPMDRIAWGGLPKPDPATPDMVAPVVCYLCSDECASSGEAFYVAGPDVALYQRERPIVGLIRKGNGEKWTIDELNTMIPETFGWYFATKPQLPGLEKEL